MDTLTKSEIELNLIKYFSEFEKDGLIIPLRKTTEIHSKTENEIYFKREWNLDYDKELFEKFFQKKLATQNIPFERFIEFEKMRFEENFKPLKQISNYGIIGHWIYFLDEKLKENDEVKENLIESQIEHYFSDTENLKLFKFFVSNWKLPNTKKSRYTYFFDYFTLEKKELFSQNQFFTFASNYSKLDLGEKRQPNATKNANDEYLKQLEKQYLTQNKQE